MTTMMEHPQHGRHPAIGSEIEHMKAHGWTICPPKVKASVDEVAAPIATVLVVKRTYNRKAK